MSYLGASLDTIGLRFGGGFFVLTLTQPMRAVTGRTQSLR